MFDGNWCALLLLLVYYWSPSWGLENGLARTPPMGWMPWERFRCITDCVKFPRDCVSEVLFKRTADLLVSEGYADVGYKFLIIDDCWMEKYRDSITRKLLPSRDRFPSGLKHLSDYIHERGLKFGLYHDVGKFTCMFQGPGAEGYFKVDTQTFAEWGVDYVKLDGCFTENEKMDDGYREFGRALNETGRPMVYSCSWPFYKSQPNYDDIAQHCNLWRFGPDVTDSPWSVLDIMNHYRRHQNTFERYGGPGHWNDPDMLVLGNYRLSYDASRLQLAIWTIMAAPLIMTNDLETVRPEIKELLQNRHIIAISQDPSGTPGKCVLVDENVQVWVRPVTPLNALGQYSYAVAFVNTGDFPSCPLCPQTFQIKLDDLKLENPTGYLVLNLFNASETLGRFKGKDVFTTRINPVGVTFYKFTAAAFY
ncbi:alpha-N-acetylgalactosaminidase-like [Scaptodrosophila lebanonensis]|uniref:Alpha-galactosidase n=1 Tax=Drosophila lebanonensis TaxID=7225 RepID=A0A6J2UJL4_DROLE|nr:alpha-N-acetylgalactosaminidase-like [Scaptodrosophila lebanonensis]